MMNVWLSLVPASFTLLAATLMPAAVVVEGAMMMHPCDGKCEQNLLEGSCANVIEKYEVGTYPNDCCALEERDGDCFILTTSSCSIYEIGSGSSPCDGVSENISCMALPGTTIIYESSAKGTGEPCPTTQYPLVPPPSQQCQNSTKAMDENMKNGEMLKKYYDVLHKDVTGHVNSQDDCRYINTYEFVCDIVFDGNNETLPRFTTLCEQAGGKIAKRTLDVTTSFLYAWSFNITVSDIPQCVAQSCPDEVYGDTLTNPVVNRFVEHLKLGEICHSMPEGGGFGKLQDFWTSFAFDVASWAGLDLGDCFGPTSSSTSTSTDETTTTTTITTETNTTGTNRAGGGGANNKLSTIPRNIPFRIDYGFFEGTTIREPTTGELKKLLKGTEQFYNEKLKEIYPNTLSSVTLTITNTSYVGGTAEFPVRVSYQAQVLFTTPAPSAEEVANQMENLNILDYLLDYVHKSNGIFEDTDHVSFNNLLKAGISSTAPPTTTGGGGGEESQGRRSLLRGSSLLPEEDDLLLIDVFDGPAED